MTIKFTQKKSYRLFFNRFNLKNLDSNLFFVYLVTLPILNYDVFLNLFSEIIFISSILITLINFKNNRINFFLISNFLGIYIIFFFISLSTLLSYNFSVSFNELIRIFQMIILFGLSVIHFRKYKNFLPKVLLYIAIFLIIYSIIFFYEILIFNFNNGIRFGNEINQINSFGYYMALGVLGLIFSSKRINLFFILQVSFFSLFILLTASRKGFILLLVALVIMVFKFKLYKKVVSYIFLIAFLYFSYLNFDTFYTLISRVYLTLQRFISGDTLDSSTRTRLEMINFGIQKFLEKPFLGHGADMYRVLYGLNFGVARPSHNNFVDLLVNFGILGFISYYSLFYFFLRNIKNSYDQKLLILSLVFLIILNDFTTNSLLFKFNWILIGFLYSQTLLNSVKRINY
jgi:O-antigen ligase